MIALAKQGRPDAYDRIVRRYYGFVRLKASSYFLAGGDADDLIQEGLVGLFKAVRDYRTDRESSFIAAEYLRERLEQDDVRPLYDVFPDDVTRLIDAIAIK